MSRRHHIINSTLLAGLLLMTVVGCAPTYRELAPGTVQMTDLQPQSAVVERQVETVPSLTPEPAPPSAYLIGLSATQAEAQLRTAYQPLIKEPWITVEVIEHRSRPLYLFGNFNKPGIVYMDRPLTLLQGIALAEGIENSAALRSARLSRAGEHDQRPAFPGPGDRRRIRSAAPLIQGHK